MDQNAFSINGDEFKDVRIDFDSQLQELIGKMFGFSSPEGEIALKVIVRMRSVKMGVSPALEYKITTSVNSRETAKGYTESESILKQDSRTLQWSTYKVPNDQIDFWEDEAP